jgi:hypothetical protein
LSTPQRLHDVFHHILTDLKTHLRADARREAVVKAGPNARIRNLFGESSDVAPMVRYAGRGSPGL